MGMITKGAMTSCIALNNYDCLIWDVPDDWTLEQAATVPVVYGTVSKTFTMPFLQKSNEN